MTKLMAPILSFTAEEIWRTFPEAMRAQGGEPSVHLTSFPETDPRWADAGLAQRWEQLLRVRDSVQGSLELVRSAKRIGSSLEAVVTVSSVPDLYAFLKEYEQELPSIFIVSQVKLKEDQDLSSDKELLIEVSPAEGQKCERCWNYRPAVGTLKDHPTLCDRCVEAVQ
jgi:isoleucyl-tRNA synthetase